MIIPINLVEKRAKMIRQKDSVILSCLRNNARQKLTEISSKTGIPVSTVHDRINVYEKKAIKKHTTLIEFDKIGFHAKINIAVKANMDSKEELQKFLSEHESTNTLYKVNPAYDFLGEFIFKNLNDAHNFVDMVEKKFNVEIQLMDVIDEIKKEEFFSNADMI